MTQLDPQLIAKRLTHLFEQMLNDKVLGNMKFLDEFFAGGVLTDANKQQLLDYYFISGSDSDGTPFSDDDEKKDRENVLNFFVEFIKTRSPNPKERAKIFLPKLAEGATTPDWSNGELRENLLKLATHAADKTLQAKKTREMAEAAKKSAAQKAQLKPAATATKEKAAQSQTDAAPDDSDDADDTTTAPEASAPAVAAPRAEFSSQVAATAATVPSVTSAGVSGTVDDLSSPANAQSEATATVPGTATQKIAVAQSTPTESAQSVSAQPPSATAATPAPPPLHDAISRTEPSSSHGEWGKGGGETGGGGASGSYDLDPPHQATGEQFIRVPGPLASFSLSATTNQKTQLPQTSQPAAPQRRTLGQKIDKISKPVPPSGTVQGNKNALQQQQQQQAAAAAAGAPIAQSADAPAQTNQATQVNSRAPKKPNGGFMKKVLAVLGVNGSIIGGSLFAGSSLGDGQTINLAAKTIKDFWIAVGQYLPHMFG